MGSNLELAVLSGLPTFEQAGNSASLDPTVDEYAKVRGVSASLAPQTEKEFAG